jgi:uncharacterized protein YkwD
VTRTITTAAMTAALISLSLAATANAGTANDNAEAAMVNAINAVRAKHGVHALQASGSLMSSAGRYSHWLMEHDAFGHGSSIQASSEFAMLGEALAMHTGRRFRVRSTLGRWMGSASHRAIVLSRTMRWLGTGVTRGRFGASRATIWVLHVGRLKPGANVPVPVPLPLPLP